MLHTWLDKISPKVFFAAMFVPHRVTCFAFHSSCISASILFSFCDRKLLWTLPGLPQGLSALLHLTTSSGVFIALAQYCSNYIIVIRNDLWLDPSCVSSGPRLFEKLNRHWCVMSMCKCL